MSEGIERLTMANRVFVAKRWGWEDIFYNGDYCMKQIRIAEGQMTSMHRHPVKDEVLLVVTGQLMLRTVPDDFDPAGASPYSIIPLLLRDGMAVRIKPGSWHQLFAVTEVALHEASTHDEEVDKQTLNIDHLCQHAATDFPQGMAPDVLERIRQHAPKAS